MPAGTAPDRGDVLAMLAGIRGDRAAPVERLDSLELVWLLHQVEQRYGVSLDLADDQLARMSTVDEAVAVLGDVLAGATTPERGR